MRPRERPSRPSKIHIVVCWPKRSRKREERYVTKKWGAGAERPLERTHTPSCTGGRLFPRGAGGEKKQDPWWRSAIARSFQTWEKKTFQKRTYSRPGVAAYNFGVKKVKKKRYLRSAKRRVVKNAVKISGKLIKRNHRIRGNSPGKKKGGEETPHKNLGRLAHGH